MSKVGDVKRIVLVVLLLAIGALVISPQEVSADARIVSGSARVKNTTQNTYTDVHITLKSDTNMTCIGLVTVVGDGTVAGTVTNNGTQAVTITWDPLPANVPPDGLIEIKWVCTQEEENDMEPIEGRFTPANSPTDIPLLGWQVTASGLVFLKNGLPEDVSFNDLRFQFPGAIDLDSMGDLVSGPASGSPAQVASGTVPAGTRLFVGQVALNEGDFLTARAETNFVDSSYSALEATQVFGHEHQVTKVGGTTELFVDGSAAPAESAAPFGGTTLPIAAAALGALVALAVGGLYVRGRIVRKRLPFREPCRSRPVPPTSAALRQASLPAAGVAQRARPHHDGAAVTRRPEQERS